jgi:hypothetical protein
MFLVISTYSNNSPLPQFRIGKFTIGGGGVVFFNWELFLQKFRTAEKWTSLGFARARLRIKFLLEFVKRQILKLTQKE